MSTISPATGVGGLLRDWRSAAPAEPARPRASRPRSRPGTSASSRRAGRAQPRARPAPRRAPRRAAARAQRAAARRRLRARPTARRRSTPTRCRRCAARSTRSSTGHEPYPAVVVDRHWDLVAANAPRWRCSPTASTPALLAPPVNALRVSLHPDGLAPRIANLAEYSAHLLERLHRQTVASRRRRARSRCTTSCGATPGVRDEPARTPTRRRCCSCRCVLRGRRPASCGSSARSPRSAPRSTSPSPSWRSSRSSRRTRRPPPLRGRAPASMGSLGSGAGVAVPSTTVGALPDAPAVVLVQQRSRPPCC